LIEAKSGEDLVVPAHAAGEFLEGGASISEERLAESLRFLRLFKIGDVNVETALRYARIVQHLRANDDLRGRSKPDLWIASWAVQNSAPLATRNSRHFGGIPDLEILAY
jgi:predicted nucleic acid-binding protein